MPQPDKVDDAAPSLQLQTIELGKTLKAVADQDPGGTPSERAAAVFTAWLAVAGPDSREPGYFADVVENFDVFLNSNKDLFDMFDILENYIEVDDEEFEPEPQRTFIDLPLLGGAPKTPSH